MIVGATKDTVRPITRDLQAGGPQGPELTPEQLEAGRRQRHALHAKMAEPADLADGGVLAGGELANPLIDPSVADNATAREDVESIEIRIPNGKVISYGRTRGAAKALVIARIIGVQAQAIMAPQVVEVLVNIRAIDGVPIKTPENMIQAQALLNTIDDDGYETLLVAHNHFWPPQRVDSLQVLQKRLR